MPYDDELFDSCACEDCTYSEYEYTTEDREDSLRNALAQMTDQEKDVLRTVLDENRVICVGSWAFTGEKQSYTCLMGTVGAELLGISHDAWVERYSYVRPTGALGMLSTGARHVPGPFDDLFGTSTAEGGLRETHTVRSVGDNINRPWLLNARGRQVVRELLG